MELNEMKSEIKYVNQSKYRKKVFEALEGYPRMPSEIAKKAEVQKLKVEEAKALAQPVTSHTYSLVITKSAYRIQSFRHAFFRILCVSAVFYVSPGTGVKKAGLCPPHS